MKDRARIGSVLVLAAVAAGCASAPVRQGVDLGVAVPEQWMAAETATGEPELLWWRTFDDPVLDDLVQEALKNNHDLKAAATRIDAAAALARIAGADRVPQIGASLGGTRQKMNFIGLPIPGEGVSSSTFTSLGLSLDLSWEIDLWGRIKAAEETALADIQAAEADYAGAQLSLAGQTAKIWFALAETRQQVELAERTIRSYHSTVRQVRARFERGLRPALDLRLALSNLHGAESLLERWKINQAALERQLETVLARYPEGAIGARPSIPPVPDPAPAGLPAELVRRRPDLVAVERRLAAADSRVAEARANLYPRFSLSASGGTSSVELTDLLDGDFGVWSVVLNLFQPIFQGGRLRAGVDLADARAREAAEIYIGSALRAYAEVETALETEVLLARLEDRIAEASRQSAAARVLAEDRYNAGLADFLSVLEAQRRDLEAEGRHIEVRRQRLDARVDLHLALGGGFQLPEIEDPEENSR